MDDAGSTQRQKLAALRERIIASYYTDKRTQHLDSAFLPSRARTIRLVELLRRLVFPGFFDEKRLTSEAVQLHVDGLLGEVHDLLHEQVREALRYEMDKAQGPHNGGGYERCDKEAERRTLVFLDRLPVLRRMLSLDAGAAFEGDPAAVDCDETIFCYPGIDAIFIHRVAHELWKLQVPLLPRIMSEYAHNETGVDIHPGATIGESFFLDHGTGVVIGETTVIGDRVKVYQGVTLGALSTRGGQAWRGRKRHPTIEDDVTIYGGAIILGGDTVIGRGSTVGGSVFLTQSVPPYHSVSMKPPELKMIARKPRDRKAKTAEDGAAAARDLNAPA